VIAGRVSRARTQSRSRLAALTDPAEAETECLCHRSRQENRCRWCLRQANRAVDRWERRSSHSRRSHRPGSHWCRWSSRPRAASRRCPWCHPEVQPAGCPCRWRAIRLSGVHWQADHSLRCRLSGRSKSYRKCLRRSPQTSSKRNSRICWWPPCGTNAHLTEEATGPPRIALKRARQKLDHHLPGSVF
jgi:hypothetical protein